MSENITDISKWEKKYPFLFDVWYTYKEFEKPVKGDASENTYLSLCDIFIKYLGEDVDKYKSGCMKLMRNLKYYAHFTKHFTPTQERCDILYNWIYNSVRDHKLKENIINVCFEEYDRGKKFLNDDVKCSYKSNKENFEKPMNIILLNIFDYNTKIIKDRLIGNNMSDKIPCQMFLCDAVKIYKLMYKTYCPDKEQDSEKIKKTCLKLRQFKESYNIFHRDLGRIKDYIPSLDDIDDDILDKCSLDAKKTLLAFGGDEMPGHTSVRGMTALVENSDNSLQRGFPDSPDVGGYSSGEDLPIPFGKGDSPMKKTITTTVGTVAGASSLLALLYKVNTQIHLNIRTIIYKCVYTKYT
ncbi:hypothetical protein PVBG_04806 [Plasmodium vivax Brazil I]|uniref:VIR protein n=1 Tax=Plasmodium vivax (strain Brazil I) TaxID=1033975 RepID=A0A0J9T1X1_PLAV1|nr:hypothetical protein PVBG_04806 [Plasmodium vivax Brazil I]